MLPRRNLYHAGGEDREIGCQFGKYWVQVHFCLNIFHDKRSRFNSTRGTLPDKSPWQVLHYMCPSNYSLWNHVKVFKMIQCRGHAKSRKTVQFCIGEEVVQPWCLLMFVHNPDWKGYDGFVEKFQNFPHIWGRRTNHHIVLQYTGNWYDWICKVIWNYNRGGWL